MNWPQARSAGFEIWLTAFYPPYEMLPAKVEAFTGFIEEQVRSFPDMSGRVVV